MRVQVIFGIDDSSEQSYESNYWIRTPHLPLQQTWSGMDGIRSVRWGNRTGNFLIQHEPLLHRIMLLSHLKAALLRHTAAVPPIGAAAQTAGTSSTAATASGTDQDFQRQDAAWAGWCLLLGVGAGFARLVGFRFAAAPWLPLASWMLTMMQGYGISPEHEASAVGDEAIPALTTGSAR